MIASACMGQTLSQLPGSNSFHVCPDFPFSWLESDYNGRIMSSKYLPSRVNLLGFFLPGNLDGKMTPELQRKIKKIPRSSPGERVLENNRSLIARPDQRNLKLSVLRQARAWRRGWNSYEKGPCRSQGGGASDCVTNIAIWSISLAASVKSVGWARSSEAWEKRVLDVVT
ncbi:hypothetical protein PoB_002462700 [Plakobranchus ocellatus]|uniref:Uncharacterized protein n=1 Tax=Plakobranchus ocellatus TaxID=259542 RepID=A0AAV3ZU99_9GAST|nr:hypothetical protein PoB_002462700 [Plakobranchus ocellatus]